MKKIISLNLVTLITLAVVSYVAYGLLLCDNFLHASISSIFLRSHHLEIKEHVLVLALVPVYISMVIFGSALLALYIGSTIQQHLIRNYKKITSPKKVF